MTALKDLPNEIGIRKASEYLRVGMLTIKRMCKRGQLKFHRIRPKGERYFYKQDLIDFINSKEVK